MGLTDFARPTAGAGAQAGATIQMPWQQQPVAVPQSGGGYGFNFGNNVQDNAQWAPVNNPTMNDRQSQAGELIARMAQQTAAYSQPTYNPQLQMLMAGIGNQQSDARADYGLTAEQLNLQQRFAGVNRDNLLAQLGLDRERIGLNRDRLGLSREGTQVDERGIRRAADTAIRGINQDFTARGSWFAPEKGAQVGDTYAKRDDDLARVDLTRRGLDVDERGLGVDERGIGLKEQGVIADFDQRLAGLGIDRRQAEMMLNRNLRDIGINAGEGVLDFMLNNAQSGGAGNMYQWLLQNLLPGMFG